MTLALYCLLYVLQLQLVLGEDIVSATDVVI